MDKRTLDARSFRSRCIKQSLAHRPAWCEVRRDGEDFIAQTILWYVPMPKWRRCLNWVARGTQAASSSLARLVSVFHERTWLDVSQGHAPSCIWLERPEREMSDLNHFIARCERSPGCMHIIRLRTCCSAGIREWWASVFYLDAT